MNYLLDTHAFLWATGESRRIPKSVLKVLEDTDVNIYVSAVSFWEIAIKVRADKLDIGKVPPKDLPDRALEMGFKLIAIESHEAASMGSLAENSHFDPFDRMLVWQAISRGMTLVSADSTLKRFKKDGLKLLW